MGQSSLIIGECSFCSNLRSRCIFESLLRPGEFGGLKVFLDLVALGCYPCWGNCSPKEFDFIGAELTFGHGEPESCCADALENFSQVVL